MRFLLAISSLGCLLAIALAAALWGRSSHATDWLRLNAMGGAAVIASSNQHIGAAIVSNADRWGTRNRKPIQFERGAPMNLLDSFSNPSLGFAFDQHGGARFIVFPLWAIYVVGMIPPLAFLATRKRSRRKQTLPVA